ncbi:apolipoprotein C-II [Microcaecilia unicolor]|uniref:Apolipoprotein C-II n=1 Tax=Microcaecilia unicolor TaxID=1415580 RepID=A0A6P7YTT1_9AMPH|nr:apolipoprotein C-II-like [Microcaecilia unicolor]
MNWKLVLASLILLFLYCEIKGDRAEEQEVPPYLDQIQGLPWRLWAQMSSTTQSWIDAAKSIEIDKKIKEAYEKSTSVIGPYTNIISDQIYHWWYGQ